MIELFSEKNLQNVQMNMMNFVNMTSKSKVILITTRKTSVQSSLRVSSLMETFKPGSGVNFVKQNSEQKVI